VQLIALVSSKPHDIAASTSLNAKAATCLQNPRFPAAYQWSIAASLFQDVLSKMIEHA